MARFGNGFTGRHVPTLGELRFSSMRREVYVQNEDGTRSDVVKERTYDLKSKTQGRMIQVRIPASAPVSGVRVRAANACRSRSPAACCSASLIRSIPNRNSASPPNSGKISVLSVILPPFWVLMPLYGPGT